MAASLIDIGRINELFNETNQFIDSNNLLATGDGQHIHKKFIDNVFEFKEIGKPFTSAVINMFLEMDIGQTIHIPLYDRDGDGDVLFRLYRVRREINQFKFEVIDVSPEAHLLMENPDTVIETEFEDSLGSVPPYVIKRVIDMLNHMMLKLCISGSMGGTGGTSRKRRKTKTMTKRKGQRKGTRKNKH